MLAEEAWDVGVLGARLKDAGLPVAETAVEQLLEVVLNWTSDSCMADDKPWNDMAVPLIPLLKGAVKPFVDKISDKDGD